MKSSRRALNEILLRRDCPRRIGSHYKRWSVNQWVTMRIALLQARCAPKSQTSPLCLYFINGLLYYISTSVHGLFIVKIVLTYPCSSNPLSHVSTSASPLSIISVKHNSSTVPSQFHFFLLKSYFVQELVHRRTNERMAFKFLKGPTSERSERLPVRSVSSRTSTPRGVTAA